MSFINPMKFLKWVHIDSYCVQWTLFIVWFHAMNALVTNVVRSDDLHTVKSTGHLPLGTSRLRLAVSANERDLKRYELKTILQMRECSRTGWRLLGQRRKEPFSELNSEEIFRWSSFVRGLHVVVHLSGEQRRIGFQDGIVHWRVNHARTLLKEFNPRKHRNYWRCQSGQTHLNVDPLQFVWDL